MSANEPRDTYTTKKKKRDECTVCPDCVWCNATGGVSAVRAGYARQPANTAAKVLSKSGRQPAHAQQVSIFKCQDPIACVGSNASLARPAAPEEACKEGFGGVACWAEMDLLAGGSTRSLWWSAHNEAGKTLGTSWI